MDLLEVTRQNKKGFSLIFGLIIIEHLAWILEPTFFGNLIDAFLENNNLSTVFSDSNRFIPLFLWIGVYFINSGAGALRRGVEPKVFQRMFAKIAGRLSDQADSKGLDVSIAAGRAQLSQEYISFFQYRVPEGIEQIISIGGAVAALTFFDYKISLACLIVALHIFYMGKIYNTKVAVLQRGYHDDYENLFKIFSSKNKEEFTRFFKSIEKSKRKIGFWNAANFSIMRLVLLIIFIIVMVIAIDDEVSIGNFYSIVAYLWTFMSSVEYLPDLMESRVAIKDISRRIKELE